MQGWWSISPVPPSSSAAPVAPHRHHYFLLSSPFLPSVALSLGCPFSPSFLPLVFPFHLLLIEAVHSSVDVCMCCSPPPLMSSPPNSSPFLTLLSGASSAATPFYYSPFAMPVAIFAAVMRQRPQLLLLPFPTFPVSSSDVL